MQADIAILDPSLQKSETPDAGRRLRKTETTVRRVGNQVTLQELPPRDGEGTDQLVNNRPSMLALA